MARVRKETREIEKKDRKLEGQNIGVLRRKQLSCYILSETVSVRRRKLISVCVAENNNAIGKTAIK